MDFNLDHGFAHWYQKEIGRKIQGTLFQICGMMRKMMFNPFFVEDKEVLVQRRQLQLDPLVAVLTANPGKSMLFSTTLRNGSGELVWEYDLIPISVGGLNP